MRLQKLHTEPRRAVCIQTQRAKQLICCLVRFYMYAIMGFKSSTDTKLLQGPTFQVCETNYLCDSISCWLLVELQQCKQLNKAIKHHSYKTLTFPRSTDNHSRGTDKVKHTLDIWWYRF